MYRYALVALLYLGEPRWAVAEEVCPGVSPLLSEAPAAEAPATEAALEAPAEPECRDEHASCDEWRATGECDANPGFMHVSCRLSCRRCATSDCADDPGADCEALRLGDADACFREELRMVERCRWSCGFCKVRGSRRCARDRAQAPAALGTRELPPGATPTLRRVFERAEEEWADRGLTVHSRDPFLVTIDGFVSDSEAEEIFAAAVIDEGFARSLAGDGVHASRTSSNRWCNESCAAQPAIAALEAKVERLVGISRAHFEFGQVLRYSPPSERYDTHEDFNSPRASPWGYRLLTAYLYLNDVPGGGGETSFPELGAAVQPRRGRLALWASVDVDDPHLRDARTRHAAIAPRSSTKYGINFWVHMYRWRPLFHAGCANAEYAENVYVDAKRDSP